MTDLPPLPLCARVVEYNAAKGYSFDAYTAEQMLAYARAAVAAAVLAEREACALTWDRLMLEACECKMTHREVVQRFAEAIRARTTGGAA